MPIKKRRDSKLPGRNTLRRLYLGEMKTMREIGDVYGVSAATVLYNLRKHNILIRDRSESSKLANQLGRRTTRCGPKAGRTIPERFDGMATCKVCKTDKELDHFRTRTDTNISTSSTCDDCSKGNGRIKRLKPEMLERGLAWCRKCRKWMVVTEFHRDDNGFGGISGNCKRCMSRNVEYHDFLREKNQLLDQGRKYCPNCDEVKSLVEFGAHAESSDGFQSLCTDCKRVVQADYYDRNREELNQKSRDYNSLPKARGRSRLWKQGNKDKVNLATQRRRANSRGNGGEYTAGQWDALIAYYCPDGKCLCCKDNRKLTPDHVIPVSAGGTSWISNIQPLCMPCNGGKHVDTTDYRPDGGEYARSLMQDA
jgi:5-methylcytosine-specific restriction endonuclease McrA